MSGQGFTITGDSGSFSVQFSTTDDFPKQDESEDRTTGGEITSQVSGVRYKCIERNIRLTQTQYAALTDLLMDGSSSYTYLPNTIPTVLTGITFPLEVRVRAPVKTNQAWGGTDGKVHFVDLEIEQIKYR